MTPAGRSAPRIEAAHRDPLTYPQGVAFMDGQYLPVSECKVSVLDWGLLHSDATYDTVHVWEGRFFRLDAHLDRFLSGAARLRMSLPLARDEIARALANCVALSGLSSAYVEMICTRGVSPTFSRDPREAVNRFIAFAVPYGSVASPEQMERGLHVALTEVQRIPPASVDPTIKNYHWLDLVGGLFRAYDAGAETALVRDAEGNIAEGPGFNVFAVREGRLTTPATGVLPGITRRTVLELAASLGLPAAEGPLSAADLRSAEEAFITSTAGGVMPVTRIDGRPVGDGRVGPVTRRLTERYWGAHADPAFSVPVAQLADGEFDEEKETRSG